MPVLPPITPSILDAVYSVVTAANTRLNGKVETLEAIGGQLVGNTSAYSQQVVNNAWRRMQEFLANIGFTALKQEALVTGLPVVAATDPALTTWINWFNYFDGANLFSQPTLPGDLIIPLKVWERPTGVNTPFPQRPMEIFFDGLPSLPKQSRNGHWEWRANAIYLPGAMQVLDLRILYQRYLGDFLDLGNVQWFQQLVPIQRCQDSFSLFVCAEIAKTRKDLDEAYWQQEAEGSARLLSNRDVSMKQRGNVRRQSRSGRLEGGGWLCGW